MTGAGLRLCEAVHVPLPCGGRGRCGNCAVYARGALSPISQDEAALLQKCTGEPPEGFTRRLACFCVLEGEAEVLLPDEAAAARPLAMGSLPDYDGGAPGLFGLAVDIGTTAITLAAYRLPEQEPVAVITEMNHQSAHGADVISRIDGDAALLHRCVTAQLADMIANTGIDSNEVTRAVVTGNTAMLHLFAGLDPSGMGRAPFTPRSLFGEAAACAFLPKAEVYLPPCITAFVGADIACGALAADILGHPSAFLIDVGTNGEMLLHVGGRLLCCSTAAGPAFEGAEISQGMPALPGAVDRVWQEGGHLRWSSVASLRPVRGICGTGMVSALRAFYERGSLDETGAIVDREDDPYLLWREDGPALWLGDCGVALTQRDVRRLQLVKASIAAGISTLLSEADVRAEGIEQVWLAGGFGSTLNPADAAAIGMIPAGLAPRARAGGNLALRGAAMLLFSKSLREEARHIARVAAEIPLATHPVFQEEFIEQMGFPELE